MDLMDLHFHLPHFHMLTAAADLSWGDRLDILLQRYDFDSLVDFLEASWKAIVGAVVATIIVVAIIFTRLSSWMLNTLVAVLQKSFVRKVTDQYLQEHRIIMPARVRTAAEFDASSAQRGHRLLIYRETITGQRIGQEGPYACSLLIEMLYLNPHFLKLRGDFKDAMRKWDELEERIRARTYKLAVAVEEHRTRHQHREQLAKLVTAIDDAEAEELKCSTALRKSQAEGSLAQCAVHHWSVRMARRLVAKRRKAYDKRKKELDHQLAPLNHTCDDELRPLLLELDAIERFELIPVVERFQADWRSIIVTIQFGRSLRKLMDTDNAEVGDDDHVNVAEVRRKLHLEHLTEDRYKDTRTLKEHFRNELKPLGIAFSPLTPVEELFEAYLRKHFIENLDDMPEEMDLDIEWLENLCAPASKGLVLREFPHPVSYKLTRQSIREAAAKAVA